MTHQNSWKKVQKGIQKAPFRVQKAPKIGASHGIFLPFCDSFGFEPAHHFSASSAQNDRSLVSVSKKASPIGNNWFRPEFVVDTILTHQNQCVRHTAGGTFLGNYFLTKKTATL